MKCFLFFIEGKSVKGSQESVGLFGEILITLQPYNKNMMTTMKKTIFGLIFAVAFSMMVACGNTTPAATTTADSTGVDTVLVDSAALDSVAADSLAL